MKFVCTALVLLCILSTYEGSTVRIFTLNPSAEKIGDIFYFHGLGDRVDNHVPLWTEWAKKGFRIFGFDLPSHGETTGAHINLYPFTRLAGLASEVEKETMEDPNRPLLLAGWSTGGLIVTRIIQELSTLKRKIKGSILFTPGVAVRTIVGENGRITVRTLTSNPNPPYRGPIKPRGPFDVPIFAGFIVTNALLSRNQRFSSSVPTLLIAAGDTIDRYVDTVKIKEWVINKRTEGSDIKAYQCKLSLHDTDNERNEVGGSVVRDLASDFAYNIVKGVKSNKKEKQNICSPF
eukprot:gene4866-8460_t